MHVCVHPCHYNPPDLFGDLILKNSISAPYSNKLQTQVQTLAQHPDCPCVACCLSCRQHRHEQHPCSWFWQGRCHLVWKISLATGRGGMMMLHHGKRGLHVGQEWGVISTGQQKLVCVGLGWGQSCIPHSHSQPQVRHTTHGCISQHGAW